MTAAETLRQAARLMRERAQAATPGPWRGDRGSVRGSDADPVRVQLAFGPPVPGVIVQSPSTPHRSNKDKIANAAHIASWHPGVALAVADWLDDYAYLAALGATSSHALTVARAYLGGDA